MKATVATAPLRTRAATVSLIILVVVNIVNFYDRHVGGALAEPLRKEFGLNDTQLGWIGTAFTVLYAIIGLPLGWLADKSSRKKLLAGGVVVWGTLTGLAAWATTLPMLIFSRLGLGVGEAACAPAATSWIGDLYPRERRAKPLALFMLGVPVGGALSFFFSGPIAQAFGWRRAMIAAAIPALLLAPVILLLKEPERGAAEKTSSPAHGSIWEVLRVPTFRWIIASGALVNFNLYAIGTFLPAFLQRVHHLKVGRAGIATGVIYAVGGLLGGVLGGGFAWGASKFTSVPTMLLVMAALSAVCAWGARTLARGMSARKPSVAAHARNASGFTALRDTPYLRLLALIVFVGAIVQSLLDYTLSTEAKAMYGNGAGLLSFFAIFQTAVGVGSFLLQLTANRLALERLGIGGTIALLPGSVVATGALALGMPSLLTAALQRGAEGVLGASLFRSAYEVLFTPVPQSLKRPTKTMIDVGFDRLGTMAGGGLTLGLIAWSPHSALRAVTAASVAAGIVQLFVAYRLHRGYVETLAEQLRAGTLELGSDNVLDATTRTTLSLTTEGLDRLALLAQLEALRAAKGGNDERATEPITELPDHETTAPDERVRVLADLRSGDAKTVRRALRRDASLMAPLAFELLELLGRDDVAREATHALAPLVPGIVGTIVDAVLDDRRPLSARRRAARLLHVVSSQRAADCLVVGLDAEELDVRYACGRVLVGMRERDPDIRYDASAALARARRELERRYVGPAETRSLEHAFNVLSLTFPREPMQLAYGALEARDPYLRGVALEYLDAVLPADLRAALTRRLEAARAIPTAAPPAPRPSTRSLDDLLKSKEMIRLSLDERRRLNDPDADPSWSLPAK